MFCFFHLFDVEDKKVLDGADSWQERAVEGADPADGLAVHDLQHVLRDGELLLAPPLGQAAVTVPHDQPAGGGGRHNGNDFNCLH